MPVAKYLKLTQSSLDIANKFSVSLGDKTFENVKQLEKALKASCLYRWIKHVDKDIYNLRQLIINLEEAQEAPLPEAQKMGILRGR